MVCPKCLDTGTFPLPRKGSMQRTGVCDCPIGEKWAERFLGAVEETLGEPNNIIAAVGEHD